MRDRSPHFLAIALLALLPFPVFGASSKQAIAPPAQTIALGESTAPLTGSWKFSPGDSPWIGDAPLWAQPTFDDSKWAGIDLTSSSSDASRVDPGWVQGWTRRGYPALSGYAWYRIRLRAANPDQQLWLKMPASFDDAYEVYANGQYVGQFGQFTAAGVTTYRSQPLSFALPQLPADGRLELALRFYMSPVALGRAPDAGGLHALPILGTASAIQLLEHAGKDSALHAFFGDFLVVFLAALALPFVLWALFCNLREQVWLWLALALLQLALAAALDAIAGLTTWIPAPSSDLWLDIVLAPLGSLLWIYFWWSWFRFRRARWIPILASLLAAAHMYARFIVLAPILGVSPVAPARLHEYSLVVLATLAAEALLLLTILFMGMRYHADEAFFAAIPILLLIFTTFPRSLSLDLGFPNLYSVHGFGISPPNIARILMLAVVAALASRRFIESSVTRVLGHRGLELEVEQVHELQQRVIAPEEIHSPCFTIESEYHPAPIVGGDFFQTALGLDGSLLIVIGDVSGRGISAAMLVAVLVGAIQTRSNDSFDPASMLATLNSRLVGRAGGHLATCLVAHLRPTGQLRLANAGHLPPYLNGIEMELGGSLPLGLAGKVEPAVQDFQLSSNDQLTFMTDGVVEARNQRGDLFGFERTCSISRESVTEIVRQVKEFGQDDDVTVLRVEFTGAPVDVASRSYTFARD